MVQLKRGYGLMAGAFIANFNSTMVQLKPAWESLGGDWYSDFNSTMVQLKLGNRFKNDTNPNEFQFHDGSIKTNYIFKEHIVGHSYFHKYQDIVNI